MYKESTIIKTEEDLNKLEKLRIENKEKDKT